MRFFDRDNEIRELRNIREVSRETARFTVLTGRRRVGKTELVKQAYSNEPYIYFYVSRKTQVNLCSEFKEIVEKVLGRTVPGRIPSLPRRRFPAGPRPPGSCADARPGMNAVPPVTFLFGCVKYS